MANTCKRWIVTGCAPFGERDRRAGKPVSKRLSLRLRDRELETGSKHRPGFVSGLAEIERTSNSISTPRRGVTEAAIAAWILVFTLLLHFFLSLRLHLLFFVPPFSSNCPFFLSHSLCFPLFLCSLFISLSLSLFYYYFSSCCFSARKLVHIRIGGRSSAARCLIKSHKNREAVSSPASYGNREVEPVLNIDSGSSLYTECVRRESLLMLNEF